MSGHGSARVALVTGVSDPVLAAAARRLTADGLNVTVHDAVPAHADAVAQTGGGVAVGADPIGRTLALHGRLDALVLDVAPPVPASWPGGAPLAAATPGLDGWLDWVAAAIPALATQGGAIVSVMGSAGRYRSGYFRPAAETSSGVAEALLNGAVLGMTRQLALELAPQRIRVNALVAGLTADAPMLATLSPLERDYLLQEISLGRFGTADEIAAAVAFLASPASSYMTGDALDANGGWWMS